MIEGTIIHNSPEIIERDLTFIDKCNNMVHVKLKEKYIGNELPRPKRFSAMAKLLSHDSSLPELMQENKELGDYISKVRQDGANIPLDTLDEQQIVRRDRKTISNTHKHKATQLSPTRKVTGIGSRSPIRNRRSEKRKTYSVRQTKYEIKGKAGSTINFSPLMKRFKQKMIPQFSTLVLNDGDEKENDPAKDLTDRREEYLVRIYEQKNDLDITRNMLKNYYKTFYKKNDEEIHDMFLFKYYLLILGIHNIINIVLLRK
jgi:hypothetical protein